jgi:hypothetical protein
LPGAFPPLAGSEYVTGDARRLAAILINGVAGPIKVKGIQYNNIMMPLPMQFPALKDDGKMTDVINYVRNSFGNKDAAGVPTDVVAAARKEFASRTTPWTEAELLNFPAPGVSAAPAAGAAPTGTAPATPVTPGANDAAAPAGPAATPAAAPTSSDPAAAPASAPAAAPAPAAGAPAAPVQNVIQP